MKRGLVVILLLLGSAVAAAGPPSQSDARRRPDELEKAALEAKKALHDALAQKPLDEQKVRAAAREVERVLDEAIRLNAELAGQQEKANTFTLTCRPDVLELKQGETAEVTLAIRRGKGFAQLVNVGADLPRGLTVEPRKFSFPSIKEPTSSKTLKVAATKTTVPGEHFITFTGYPEDGSIASVQLTVRVKKAD